MNTIDTVQLSTKIRERERNRRQLRMWMRFVAGLALLAACVAILTACLIRGAEVISAQIEALGR